MSWGKLGKLGKFSSSSKSSIMVSITYHSKVISYTDDILTRVLAKSSSITHPFKSFVDLLQALDIKGRGVMIGVKHIHVVPNQETALESFILIVFKL